MLYWRYGKGYNLDISNDRNMALEAKLSSSSARMCSMAVSRKVVEVNPGAVLRDDFPERFSICNMMLAWFLSNGTPCFFSNGFLGVCLSFSSQQHFHAHLPCSLCLLRTQKNRVTELYQPKSSSSFSLQRDFHFSFECQSASPLCSHLSHSILSSSCGLASKVLPCEEWSLLLCTGHGWLSPCCFLWW